MDAGKPKVRYTYIFIGLAIAIIAGFIFLRGESQNTSAAESEKETAITLSAMEITSVTPQDRVRGIRISGSLQPVQRVQLHAKVSGTIAILNVDIGDAVKAGDVLVEFDTKDLRSTLDERRAALKALEAQHDVAKNALQRARSLHAQGYTPKATLDETASAALQLQAQIQGVKAQITTAEKALNDARVIAPFDGVVASRPIEQGQTMSVNTELVSLVDLSRMELVAKIPTSRIAQVKSGQKANLQVEGYGDRLFDGEVTRISPVAENNARTVPVYMQLSNHDGLLRGGMFASGQLNVMEYKNIIVLPLSAVREDETGKYVLTVVNGILERQNITVGETWTEDYRVQVTTGLDAGDRVVSAVLPELKTGMKVHVPAEDAPAAGL